MNRLAWLALLLLLSTASAENLLSLGEEAPLDEWVPAGRDHFGLGVRSGEALPRARGEWSRRGLRILGELRAGETQSVRVSTALARGPFRLVWGSLTREEGLLGRERRRARLGSLTSIVGRKSSISLAGKSRGAFLDWRIPGAQARLAWETDFGAQIDARKGPWRVAWRQASAGSAASMGFRRDLGDEIIDLELAAAGKRWNRCGMKVRLHSEASSFQAGAEGMMLSGPRPVDWKSRGWIGASAGGEGGLAASWRRGGLRLRAALRWRRGIGLAEGRRRREALLVAHLRRGQGSWRLELRRVEDFDWDVPENSVAFPIWIESRTARWEGRLAWKKGLNWEAVLRSSSGEDANSVLLRMGSGERRWRALGFILKMNLYRTSPAGSYRFVGGGFLDRSDRILRGRGALLSGSLRLGRRSFSAGLDVDVGTGQPARIGLTLRWERE